MPTYEYACEACRHKFEQFQSIVSKAVKKCPKCGKLKVKRLIGSGAGFIFKGSGFYQTDYRSSKYKESAKKESPKPAPKPETKSEPKSESKADAKPKKEGR